MAGTERAIEHKVLSAELDRLALEIQAVQCARAPKRRISPSAGTPPKASHKRFAAAVMDTKFHMEGSGSTSSTLFAHSGPEIVD